MFDKLPITAIRVIRKIINRSFIKNFPVAFEIFNCFIKV